VTVPTYRVEVPLYAALPEQFRQSNLAMVGNLHQRVGDDAAGAITATSGQGYRQAWARIIRMDRTIGQAGTVSPRSEGRLTGFQAGADLWANRNWHVGLYVGELEGHMDVNGFARGLPNYAVGSNELRSQYLGAYATWKNDSGLYLDGVLQAGRHRYTAATALGSAGSGKGDSLLASIEVGQGFRISPDWIVEPQLQLVHQRVSLDDASIVGALVQQDSHSGWLVRAGVRVKGEMTTSAGPLQPYARLNLYRSSSGTDVTRFIGPAGFTDIATRTGGTSTELAAGATLRLTPGMSLYGEVGKLWASGGGARVKSGLNASVGLKVRW
jgi:outer membrane autotransporter protein